MSQHVEHETSMTQDRIAVLEAYAVMDTPPERDIDDVTRLAAQICGTPVALVTLVDGRRQFFKGRFGFDAVTSDLETGFCPLVVAQAAPVTIGDTLLDERHALNKATVEGGVRFYAGVPLQTAEGHILGTLCVLDVQPRTLDDGQHAALASLARQVMTQLDLRSALRRERESDLRHRLTLDSAVDYAIVRLDAHGIVRDWNAGAEHVLRVTSEAASGRRLDDLLSVTEVSDWLGLDTVAARDGGRVAEEGWCQRGDGSAFWGRRTMTVIRSAHDDVTGFVVVVLDRTAERRRELSLTLLASAAADLLAAADPDAALEALLAEGAGLIGFEHAYNYVVASDGQHLCLTAAIGLSDEERLAFANAPFETTTCASVVHTRQRLVINDLQSSDNPRCRPVQTLGLTAYAAFPVMVGERLYGVLSFGSVRLHRFDEEALTFFATLARYMSMARDHQAGTQAARAFADTLEQRVEERTAALRDAEAALQQSQKMEAVGQLTGGVAHDFNNLLTIIRSSVDLLRRPDLGEDRRRRYIDAVSDTVDRAAKLTGQLLAFARRQALKPEVFDVGARLGAVGEMLDSVTGARIQVVIELPEDPCFVKADLSQFETALVNMAVNARDAMDGAGVLTLRLTCTADLPSIRGHAGASGPFAAITLSDTGTGMTADVMARIFEPFFTTKGVGKGTGLGLSQVFGFVKQSGGDIDVTSAPGRGTTLTLFLPEVAVTLEAKRETVSRAPSPGGAGRRVLVVEDNIEVGRFSTQVLQDLGYQTTWAANAEEALLKIGDKGADFDVVFSDVVMPGMGGIELAKRLRRSLPDLPVVLASGYSHVLAQEGTHGFELLHKPYSAEQLSRTLRRVASKKRG